MSNPNIAQYGIATRWTKENRPTRPGGRPPMKPITSALLEVLSETDPKTKRTKAQQLARAIVGKAKRGSVPAFEAVADRVEGKPIQMQATIVAHISADEIADARDLAASLRCNALPGTAPHDEQVIDTTVVVDTPIE